MSIDKEAAVTKDETQQFTNAVADLDLAEPEINPNDWFKAAIKTRLAVTVLIAEFPSGQTVWIHERDITKRPAHSLCLPAGTTVYVRMRVNTGGHRYEYRALEAQIDGEPTKHAEQGTITNWRGSFGGARMDCGCNIFLRTRGSDEQLNLRISDLVTFSLMYSEKNKKWFGCNIVSAP